MRANPGLDIETAITELAVGEALVSFLDDKGRPSVTERVFVLPPGSQIGPITPEQRKALIAGSLVAGVYEKTVDRESAYEKLKGRVEAPSADAGEAAASRRLPGHGTATPAQDDGGGLMGGLKDMLFGSTGPRGGKHEGLAETAARVGGAQRSARRSAARSSAACWARCSAVAAAAEATRSASPGLAARRRGSPVRRCALWRLLRPTAREPGRARRQAESAVDNAQQRQQPGRTVARPPAAGTAAIEPLSVKGDGPASMARLAQIVEGMAGARIVERRSDYLYVQFTTKLMRFVDDTEFWFDPAAGVIHVRSASRVGSNDFGVNRARIEAIRARLNG